MTPIATSATTTAPAAPAGAGVRRGGTGALTAYLVVVIAIIVVRQVNDYVIVSVYINRRCGCRWRVWRHRHRDRGER